MTESLIATTDLKLGDTVYEACPWTGRVFTRYVLYEIITSKWDDRRGCGVAPGFPKRRIIISDGMLGDGKEATADDWEKRYFVTLTEAHRVCAERAVAMKAEHRLQIENEIRELEKQLKELGE